MAHTLMIFCFIFLIGFGFALVLTPLVARLARRTGAMDYPRNRHWHAHPTPKLGGVSLGGAFFVAVGASLLYPRTDPNELVRLGGLLIGGAIMLGVGVLDDHRELPALPQLAAQFSAASVAVLSGIHILEIANPFGGVITLDAGWAILFTIFWLMGMMNTINWIDGLDGLAGGIVAIAGAVLFIHTFQLGQYSLALLALALIGAVLGFLPYNFAPAKIFMSGGAPWLGFVLGGLAIIGGAKVATALLVLGIPILDVAWQIVNRVRAGRSPFAADRGHLHHLLLDLGVPARVIVFVYYAVTLCLGALALLLPSGIYKLIALIAIGAGALFFLIQLGQRANLKK